MRNLPAETTPSSALSNNLRSHRQTRAHFPEGRLISFPRLLLARSTLRPFPSTLANRPSFHSINFEVISLHIPFIPLSPNLVSYLLPASLIVFSLPVSFSSFPTTPSNLAVVFQPWLPVTHHKPKPTYLQSRIPSRPHDPRPSPDTSRHSIPPLYFMLSRLILPEPPNHLPSSLLPSGTLLAPHAVFRSLVHHLYL